MPLYTMGQRKGVEIGGTGPYYVAKTDYKTNTLYVVNDGHDKALYSDSLKTRNINWISGREPKMPLKCQAQIRYRHKDVDCVVKKKKAPDAQGKRRISYVVKFKEPQRAVTPGQSVVFYRSSRRTIPSTRDAHANENNEDELLGGGVIEVSNFE